MGLVEESISQPPDHDLISLLDKQLFQVMDGVKSKQRELLKLQGQIADFFRARAETLVESLERLERARRDAADTLDSVLGDGSFPPTIYDYFNCLREDLEEIARILMCRYQARFWLFAGNRGNGTVETEFDLFREFQAAPSHNELRALRQIYLRIAKRYHPDLLGSKLDKEYLTDVMQRVVAHHERHDAVALLELEAELDSRFPFSKDPRSSRSDRDFSHTVKQLSREVALCKLQLDRIEETIQRTKASTLGTCYFASFSACSLPEQSFSLFLHEIGDATNELCRLIDVTNKIADTHTAPVDESSTWIRPRLWKTQTPGLTPKQTKKFLGELSNIRSFFVKNIFQPAQS